MKNSIYYLFLITYLISTQFSYSQNQKNDDEFSILFPFYVVHADSTYEFSEWLVKNGKTFRLKDNLTLKNGHLILSHYSGQLFEFTGDTTISLKKLSKSIEYDNQYFKTQFYKFLNDTIPVRNIKYATGAVCRPGKNIEFVYPEDKKVNVHRNSLVHLQWVASYKNYQQLNYQIKLLNIFDEVLSEKTVLGNETKIDFSQLASEEEIILVEVSYSHDEQVSKNYIAYEFIEGQQEDSDQFQTSIQCLQQGAQLEAKGSYLEAKGYYQKATALSNQKVYQQLLQNFLIRKKTN